MYRTAALVLLLFAGPALAQPPPPTDPAPIEPSVEPPVEPPPPVEPVTPPPSPPAHPAEAAPVDLRPLLSRYLSVRGFLSQGAFISTANDYLGKSSRGSLELFEAGLTISAELSDQLRVGMQLFSRDVGTLGDYTIDLDWAYLDYRWKPWLGLRAGHIKLPFGLYNEYTDIDVARVSILMPQSLYPIDSRDVLLAHTGFSVYGEARTTIGTLTYQLFGGTFLIEPASSAQARADSIDSKYVVGGQVFLSPHEGLRVGASYLRASIDYFFTLEPSQIQMYVDAGVVPPDFDGKVALYQRPATLVVGSAEYLRDDWTFAAEYSRWLVRFRAEPALIPTTESDSERFYVLAAKRLSDRHELGGYYSVYHVDAADRRGRDTMQFARPQDAFQRDAALTLRYDVNEHWLWKLEGHLVDGTAALVRTTNPDPTRTWGLFLIRTTLTF